MLLSPLVMLLVLVVGMLVGSIGIGGVLQVPVLRYLGDYAMHTIIPACMLAYLLPGMVGAMVYHRHGNLHWPSAWRLCLGAMPGALLGAWLLPMAPALLLELLVAALILFSGFDALVRKTPKDTAGGSLQTSGYFAVGLVTGTASALTGAGGPLMLVPLLIWFRVPVRIIVGLGQIIQIPISIMATAGNLKNGAVDLQLSLWLAIVLSAGVFLGGWAAHRLPEQGLKKTVAVLLVLVGVMMLARALL